MEMMNTAVTSVPTGTVQTGSTAAAGAATAGTGFGQLLVQVMGSSSTGQTGSGTLPNLVQMLEGLFGNLPLDEMASLTDEGGLEALNALLEQLSEQPELLDELLGSDEMQEWLMQAAMLLQGMQILPVAQEAAPGTGENPQADDVRIEGTGIGRQKGLEILKAFTQATNEQPDSIFLEQLQEKLAKIVGGTQTNKGPEASEGTKVGTNSQGASVKDLDLTVQTVKTVSHASRLEILAAKTMPVNRLEAILGTGEQGGLEAAATAATESDTQPLNMFAQDPNRIAVQNASITSEAVINADTLVEDMNAFMMSKLRLQTGNGLTEARLTLNPEALGQVDVKLTLQNGQLVAQFSAHTLMGKETLESQMAQLRATLQSQGIQVEKMEVTQSPSLQSGMFQDQRHQQQSRQFNNRQNQSSSSSDGSDEYAAEASAILNGRRQTGRDGFDVIA